jgi:periplasmic protein TonB
MAYADQDSSLSTNKVISIGIVALLHVGLGYALVTGLAFDAAKQVFEDLKTFDVQEEKPPEPEEPPPPPEKLDIPPPPKVTAPPPVNVTPVISTNTQAVTITPSAPPAPPPPPPAPPPPPPPPAAPKIAQKAVQRGGVGSITDDDYPPDAVRNEESGVTTASYVIGTDGKVESCEASGASASLDSQTCKLIMKRFKFKPALDENGSPISEKRTQRIRWNLPK